METYRVAILGCRGRGTAAGRAYHAHPRTEVVALCDLVQERLDTLGDELGVPTSVRYTDLDKMIEETQPDIVAIPTGTEFHYTLSMGVLEHGVSIDVEKPMCQALDEADVNRVLEILDDLGADRQTDELTEATAEEGRAALAMLELPPWATEDAKNLIDFMAYRLF